MHSKVFATFVFACASLLVSASPIPISPPLDVEARQPEPLIPNPSRREPEPLAPYPSRREPEPVERVEREAEPEPKPWCRFGCI